MICHYYFNNGEFTTDFSDLLEIYYNGDYDLVAIVNFLDELEDIEEQPNSSSADIERYKEKHALIYKQAQVFETHIYTKSKVTPTYNELGGVIYDLNEHIEYGSVYWG